MKRIYYQQLAIQVVGLFDDILSLRCKLLTGKVVGLFDDILSLRCKSLFKTQGTMSVEWSSFVWAKSERKITARG